MLASTDHPLAGDQPIDISAYLEIFSDHGLPTLMPDWAALEDSELPIPLSSVISSQGDRESKVLLILHAYHLDPLGPFLISLRQNIFFHDQVITTDTPEKARQIQSIHSEIMGDRCKLVVQIVPNCGRDVLPFWLALQQHGSHYDAFLKLHLKQSKHWEDLGYVETTSSQKDAGTQWSEDIVRCLIPSSPNECQALITAMQSFGLGALFPRPHEVVHRFGWGDEQNLIIASRVLQEFGIDQSQLLAPLIFPAGNMFWGLVRSFLPFKQLFLQAEGYPDEPIPIDGTFLHAIERCTSYLLASSDSNVGILFPPSLEQEPARPCIRLLPVDLTRYLRQKWLSNHSPAYLVHQRYINAIVEGRESIRNLRQEIEALKKQIQFINNSRLARLRRLLRGT